MPSLFFCTELHENKKGKPYPGLPVLYAKMQRVIRVFRLFRRVLIQCCVLESINFLR